MTKENINSECTLNQAMEMGLTEEEFELNILLNTRYKYTNRHKISETICRRKIMINVKGVNSPGQP